MEVGVEGEGDGEGFWEGAKEEGIELGERD